MLLTPLSYRRDIPFFVEKSAAEFRADPYEDYQGQVVRQMTLHHGFPQAYAWQTLQDWMLQHLQPAQVIVEIGCGVGQLIASVAEQHPNSQCIGLDYSYQLLRVAQDYYRSSKALSWRHPGFAQAFHRPPRSPLPNLQFGLTHAAHLPFPDASVDVLLSSFLFDRLNDPTAALQEWSRVIRPGGQLLLATPLNFQQPQHWHDFYPTQKLAAALQQQGWPLHAPAEKLLLRQPLDQTGNTIEWNVWMFKCLMSDV